MTNALIIFQKNPQPGKVKTRLAATVGNENALKIYRILVDHTHKIAETTFAKKYVYFSDFIEEKDRWKDYNCKVQSGNDLGEKMYNAIQEVQSEGAENVVVIGTDCYELTAEIIKDAFISLITHDYCIGPAEDGGYYLIGTNSPDTSVFLNKEWSTVTVCEEALLSIRKLKKEAFTLAMLSDVDYEEDLKTLRQFLI